MKMFYNSLEELRSGCATSALLGHVASVFSRNEYIKWSFVSASVDGDECRSEFRAQIKDSDLERRLSCRINPRWNPGIRPFPASRPPWRAKIFEVKEVKVLAALFYSAACPAIIGPGRTTPGDALAGVSAYA